MKRTQAFCVMINGVDGGNGAIAPQVEWRNGVPITGCLIHSDKVHRISGCLCGTSLPSSTIWQRHLS